MGSKLTVDHLRALPDGSLTQAEVAVLCDEIERLRTALETLQREHLTCTPLRRANVIDRALIRGPEASGQEAPVTDRPA